jgi:hypothetical protein
MSVIDKIRKKQLLDSPETVNTDWASPSVSIDDRTGEFSLSLKYESGTSVEMNVYMQLSVDDINFGDLENDEGEVVFAQITDPDGVVIFDLDGSGAQYARIRVEVISGSIDVVEIKYVASQFH